MTVVEKFYSITGEPRVGEMEKYSYGLQNLTKEQLKLVEAALGGTAYQRSKAVWITDDVGNRSKVQRPVKLRQWWTVGTNGAVQFGLRYGAVPLEVKAGMSAVEVSKLADVPLLIKALVQAVDQGELDAAIDAVTAARKSKGKRAAEA